MDMIFEIITPVAEVIISLCMLIVAIFTAWLSFKLTDDNRKITEEHYRIEIMPRHNIICSTYDSIIRLAIYNAGHGMMIIRKIIIKDKESGTVYERADHILSQEITLKYYSVFDGEYVLRPGEHLTLLKTYRLSDEQKRLVSDKLKNCIVEIEYMDAHEDVSYNGRKELGGVFKKW